MAHPFASLGLKRVINASGKMTALGGSAQSALVAARLAETAQAHVDMAELRRVAGEAVAARCGAEAGNITSGAAAGIAIGVAAMICANDRDQFRKIPHPDAPRREIVLLREHDVDFGARVSQMIALGGGIATAVERATLAQAVGERTAGLLYVQSHHVRGEAVPLAELIGVARVAGVPLLVDAAAEADLTAYVEAGADLVTYSGGKAIGGPTVGFVVGERSLIELCELQNRGFARAMKVGKEQIGALLAALSQYGEAAVADLTPALAGALRGALPELSVGVCPDRAGRAIERVAIYNDDVAWLRALAQRLREGDPAIYARAHEVEEGRLLFDTREIAAADVETIVAGVRRAVGQL